MDAKFVEESSRESTRFAQSKENVKTRATSRGPPSGPGGGGGGSGTWGNGPEARGTRCKSGHRQSVQGKTKKTRQSDTSPKGPSKNSVPENASGLVLSRHLRDTLEAWEDLVVERGDRKQPSKIAGKTKLKKYRIVNNTDSVTEFKDSRKEKIPYHIKQVSKETIERENVKNRQTEKPRKGKDLPKSILLPEAQYSPRMKISRQKTVSSESRFRTSPKCKRDDKRDRADRSLPQSNELMETPKEELQRNVVAPEESQDTLKACDRPWSPSLLAESTPTRYITLGDSICIGDTQPQPDAKSSVEMSKWQQTRIDGANLCGGKGPHEAVWNSLAADECVGKDSGTEARVNRTSRSTCRGGSGDDIPHKVKAGSISSVCSRLSTDTCDSPNRALTPGLTAEERADLESGHDILFTPVEPNVRVRSSTNPRNTEESSYSARSRSVSAGTAITRNRYKKHTRKRRGSTTHTLRCNDVSLRYSRSPQCALIRSDIPVKFSRTGNRGRKSSPNAMMSWDGTFCVTTNRKSSKELRTKRFHKFKSSSLFDGKHDTPGQKFEVRMSLDDVEEYEEHMNDLDLKLDFAMEEALRVAGLRESDSQPDSSQTVISSQECELPASKDDYMDCKESVWCPFVRRPLSAVPEEDSHCSSSNKEYPKSEFDLELMLKHRANSSDDSAINAVLNQLFREGSRDAIVPEYEPTFPDATYLIRASPSTLTLMPKSSGTTMNLQQNKNDISSEEQTTRCFTQIMHVKIPETTSTLTSIIPRTTESDSRTDEYETIEKSSEVITGKTKSGIQEESNALHNNSQESNFDTNSTRHKNTMPSRILDANDIPHISQPKEIVITAESKDTCDKISTTCSREDNNNKRVQDTDTRLVREEENDLSDTNICQINISKPGVFIALDTLLMQYEESYSSSSADVLLDSKAESSNNWLDEFSKENESSISSRSRCANISDNTFENIKSIPKSTDNADNITEITILKSSLKGKCNKEIMYEALEVDTASFNSDSSILGDEQTDKQSELKVENVSSSTTAVSSDRKEHVSIACKKIHRPNSSANYCLPPKDAITLPTTNSFTIPNRFVVQEDGTFKEPSTPFNFVLTVNLHGPTHLDSSIEGSDECDRESSSSLSSAGVCLDNRISRKTRGTDEKSGRHFRNGEQTTLPAENTNNLNQPLKPTSSPNTPRNEFLEKFEHLYKYNFTSSSGYVCDSENSDSDRPSTIPSVLNLEDLEEQSTRRDCKSIPKPNTETIDCISNICQKWRQSLEHLTFLDEDSAGNGTNLSHKLQNTESSSPQQSKLIPQSTINKNVAIPNEKRQSLQKAEERRSVEIVQQKTRRRVSLKLFSDWDVINRLIEQGGMGGYFITKEPIDGDLASNASSVRKSSNSTISYKSSLKRKRPSKSSTEEWGVIRHLKEIMQQSTEDNSSLSSISHILSVSGTDDGSKGFSPFHFLPRIDRKEIARDKRAIMKQNISVSQFMGSSMSDDRNSEISHVSCNESMRTISPTFIPVEREDSILEMQNELVDANELISKNVSQVDDVFDKNLSDGRENEFSILKGGYKSNAISEDSARAVFSIGEETLHYGLNRKESKEKYNQNDFYACKVNLENSSPGEENSTLQSQELRNIRNTEEKYFKQKESLHDSENISSSQKPSKHTPTTVDSFLGQMTHEKNVVNKDKDQTLATQYKNEERDKETMLKNNKIPFEEKIIQHEARQDIITFDEKQATSFEDQLVSVYKNQTSNIDAALFVQKHDSCSENKEVIQTNGSDLSQMSRAIWEGVALTVLVDAATVINKIMNGPGSICENRTVLECDAENAIKEETLEKGISIVKHNTEGTKQKEPSQNTDSNICDKKIVLKNIKESSFMKKFASRRKGLVSECTERDFKFDGSSSSTEGTDQHTSSESCSSHDNHNVCLPATQSRNISVYLPNSVWEDVGIPYTDYTSEDKTGSSTTRKTSNEEVFVTSKSAYIPIERHMSTQTSSDWETISQSLEDTAEGEKDSEDSKLKVLESLWRCRSQHQASDWDTSTETIGLIHPLTSFASAPTNVHADMSLRSVSTSVDMDGALRACVSATASMVPGDNEMQLVFMREDVRFTESEDSTVRCFEWSNPSNESIPKAALLPQPLLPQPTSVTTHSPQLLGRQAPPPPPPPPPPPLLRSVACKSEAVQVTFPELTISPPESAPPPVWNDRTSFEQTDVQPEHQFESKEKCNFVAPSTTELNSKVLRALRPRFSSDTHPEPTPEELIYMTPETNSDLDTETDETLCPLQVTHEHQKQEIDETALMSYESSMDSESDSDALGTMEIMKRLGPHALADHHHPGTRHYSQRRHAYSRPTNLGVHRMFLSPDLTQSKHEGGTDLTNSVIAFFCLVLAIVVINSILCANNIIVFK